MQTKLQRKDDDLATLRSEHSKEVATFHNELADLNSEVSSLRDTLQEKEREIEEAYSGAVGESSETKELNKRLAQLANDNMSLRDQLEGYRNELKQ